MHFTTSTLLAAFSLISLSGISLAKPLPQGGYAVPSGPGNGKCAGSDSNRRYTDVLACPGKPEAVRNICRGQEWNKESQSCGNTRYQPLCVNGNFCTGSHPGKLKIGDETVDMIEYYNNSGCNCNG